MHVPVIEEILKRKAKFGGLEDLCEKSDPSLITDLKAEVILILALNKLKSLLYFREAAEH